MKKQNLRSEAAIKRWLKLSERSRLAILSYLDSNIIELYGSFTDKTILFAEIDLRELIKKRKPLTGIKKQMSAIVSGKKNKKVKK